MSEPQRRDLGQATPGEEPGAGIADPATVAGGTIGAGDTAAQAVPEQVDPAGYPHEPAPEVPQNPPDASDRAEDTSREVREAREEVRDTGGLGEGEDQGSWGPGWERE